MKLLKLPSDSTASLSDRLFDAGVEFPCAGQGACGGCRIRVVAGDIPVTPAMREALTEHELADGWRLACCAESHLPLIVEVEQWSLPVLTDERSVPFEPRQGLGIAVDLGTTTVVAQLVDLQTGDVLDVATGLNPQARHGADVMSRIQADLSSPGRLTSLIRQSIGAMIGRLAAGRPIVEVLLCGNTAMHHLFCGLSVEPLSHVPFESPALGGCRFSALDLHWTPDAGTVAFLPCLAGFVGSDLLAGIVATNLDSQATTHALFDIGTNGEIVVGSRDGIRCASTAAGPAFEGGRISCGMRAGHGAIDRVDDAMNYHVIGGAEPRGICGSGLVDAIAAAHSAGRVLDSGRLAGSAKTIPLAASVSLKQSDVRELQLAKGAMAAGLRMLGTAGASSIWLAGAFGNYIKPASARAIGLLPDNVPVEPVGNAALRGTRMLLLSPSRRAGRLDRIRHLTQHVELAADRNFETTYAECMALRSCTL